MFTLKSDYSKLKIGLSSRRNTRIKDHSIDSYTDYKPNRKCFIRSRNNLPDAENSSHYGSIITHKPNHTKSEQVLPTINQVEAWVQK